jgi:hypothetical protein
MSKITLIFFVTNHYLKHLDLCMFCSWAMKVKTGENTAGLKAMNGMTVTKDINGSVYYYRSCYALF